MMMMSIQGRRLKERIGFKNISLKKVVVKQEIKSFTEECGKKFMFLESYKGMFKLIGDPEDLQFIYQSGLSYRRSQGFGLLDLVM